MADGEMGLEGTESGDAEELLKRFLAAVGAEVPDSNALLGVTLVVHVEPFGLPQARRHDLMQVCRRGFQRELLREAALCIAEALEDGHDGDDFDPSQN